MKGPPTVFTYVDASQRAPLKKSFLQRDLIRDKRQNKPPLKTRISPSLLLFSSLSIPVTNPPPPVNPLPLLSTGCRGGHEGQQASGRRSVSSAKRRETQSTPSSPTSRRSRSNSRAGALTSYGHHAVGAHAGAHAHNAHAHSECTCMTPEQFASLRSYQYNAALRGTCCAR